MKNKITIEQFTESLRNVYEFGRQLGIDNILDKYKFREHQLASILKHDVFTKASGGKDNDETFGADASYKNSEGKTVKAEYKTSRIKGRELKSLNEGKQTNLSMSMVYNGAYTKEKIDSYKDIEHYGSIHNDEDVVAIVKIDYSYVKTRLYVGVDKMKEIEGKTTNCNSFTVYIKDGKVYGNNSNGSDYSKTEVGELVYLNENYKVK